MNIIFPALALTALFIASIHDLKVREVPDQLNYGLIIAAILIRSLFSIVNNDASFLIEGISGLLFCFIIAIIMFYTGQWGGGDGKMIMALGAVFGYTDHSRLFIIPAIIWAGAYLIFGYFSERKGWLKKRLASLKEKIKNLALNIYLLIGVMLFFITILTRKDQTIPFIYHLLVNILLFGCAWGLLYTITTAIANRKEYLKEYGKKMKNHKPHRIITLTAAFIIIAIAFILTDPLLKITFGLVGMMSVLTFYMWIFTHAVEKSCMITKISPTKLTEGDWLAKKIIHKGKVVAVPSKIGLDRKDYEKIMKLYKKKKIKTVLVKYGIPFIPSFFVATLVTLFFNSVLSYLL